MATQVQSTIDALRGDLTALGGKGTDAIKKWEDKLESADWRGAKTIHEDLGKLRRHLEGDDLDPQKIGELLTKLGEATERAAEHAEGNSGAGLKDLAAALQEAGAGLGK